ncbi:TonB-dependent receptor [Pedobacter sp.]
MMVIRSVLILISFTTTAWGQKTITGIVLNRADQPIENVTISLKLNGNVIKYTKTNTTGKYALEIPEIFNPALIEAKYFGYQATSQGYNSAQTIYNFKLVESAINLDSITVKYKPKIIQKGDTLNYRTADFSNIDDRSIGDVLKKMPGITVQESGKILFNNKPISNFYIDGDNLLDDKYNIGTKSIPHKAVTKIQVIDHDQPIKMLQKNNQSTDVAINLVIDKNAKLKIMGNAKIGAGTPTRYDENLNMMVFKNRIKFLNNLALNNIGTLLSTDVASHNNSINISKNQNNRPNFQLNTGISPTPYLSKSKSLFNNSGILNTNTLYKVSSEKQIKANVYYLNERQEQSSAYKTQLQLPNEHIEYAEKQQNKAISQSIYGQVNYIDNASNHYINNSLKIGYNPEKQKSLIDGYQFNFNQLLNQRRLNIVNDLKYLKELKSGVILNLNSYLEKNNQTELLNISPGINLAIINAGNNYNSLQQQLSIPGFFTNNYISYALTKGKFTQSYQAGFNYQALNYNSNLQKELSNNNIETFSNGINDINWYKTKIYLNPKLKYKNETFILDLQAPFSFNAINYNLNSSAYHRIFISPSFNVEYKPSQQIKITTGYAFNQQMAGIDAIFTGVILKNYRSLTANNNALPFSKMHQTSLGLNYQHPIRMFFANAKAIYSNTLNNNIFQSLISNNISVQEAIPYRNSVKNYTISGEIGKYVIGLNTNLSLNFQASKNNGEQLQNGYKLLYNNHNYTIGINSNAKITKAINWMLHSNYTRFDNFFNDTKAGELNQFRVFSNLNTTVLSKITFSISANQIFIRQAKQQDLNYLFTDINVKYKATKLKTDFELGLNNINNEKVFSSYYLNSNSFTASNYQIPGRYLMLKVFFAFN